MSARNLGVSAELPVSEKTFNLLVILLVPKYLTHYVTLLLVGNHWSLEVTCTSGVSLIDFPSDFSLASFTCAILIAFGALEFLIGSFIEFLHSFLERFNPRPSLLRVPSVCGARRQTGLFKETGEQS